MFYRTELCPESFHRKKRFIILHPNLTLPSSVSYATSEVGQNRRELHTLIIKIYFKSFRPLSHIHIYCIGSQVIRISTQILFMKINDRRRCVGMPKTQIFSLVIIYF